MAMKLEWSDRSLLDTQAISLNGLPQFSLQTAKGLMKKQSTALMDSTSGRVLGEIGWKAHALSIGGKNALTKDLKWKKGGWGSGRHRIWRWSDINYDFHHRYGAWEITIVNQPKQSSKNNPPIAFFMPTVGILSARRTTFTLQPSSLIQSKGEDEWIFLLLAVLYSEEKRRARGDAARTSAAAGSASAAGAAATSASVAGSTAC